MVSVSSWYWRATHISNKDKSVVNCHFPSSPSFTVQILPLAPWYRRKNSRYSKVHCPLLMFSPLVSCSLLLLPPDCSGRDRWCPSLMEPQVLQGQAASEDISGCCQLHGFPGGWRVLSGSGILCWWYCGRKNLYIPYGADPTFPLPPLLSWCLYTSCLYPSYHKWDKALPCNLVLQGLLNSRGRNKILHAIRSSACSQSFHICAVNTNWAKCMQGVLHAYFLLRQLYLGVFCVPILQMRI